MTRSMRSRFEAPQDPEMVQRKHQRNKRLTRMAALIAVVVGVALYMLNEVSGVYMGNHDDLGVISLTISQSGSSVSGKLSYGRTAAMDCKGSLSGDKLSLKAQTAKRWIDEGQPLRTASFTGTANPETIEGEIKEGTRRFRIRLDRDLTSTIFRWFSNLFSFL